jgi:hypothetical protein
MATQEIVFPNGHRAQVVDLPAGSPAASAIQTLKIPPAQALVMLLGGAKELAAVALTPRLLQLLSRGLARVAGRLGAIIIDGGRLAQSSGRKSLSIQIFWFPEIWTGKEIHRHSRECMVLTDFDSHHLTPCLNG